MKTSKKKTVKNKNSFKTDGIFFKKVEKIILKELKEYSKCYEDCPNYLEILTYLIDSYSTGLTDFGRKHLVKELKELIEEVKP